MIRVTASVATAITVMMRQGTPASLSARKCSGAPSLQGSPWNGLLLERAIIWIREEGLVGGRGDGGEHFPR